MFPIKTSYFSIRNYCLAMLRLGGAETDNHGKHFRALLDQGYDPNAFDNDSWTPLHYCAFYGKLKVAQVLMNHATTNVNLTNKKGETPLHFAAMNGFHHLIELILSNAKINKVRLLLSYQLN